MRDLENCAYKEKSVKYGKLIILNVDGVIWIVDGMLCGGMWFMMMIWCEWWYLWCVNSA